jgi:uncharacterized membrane protein YfbV (UPF0208 family)
MAVVEVAEIDIRLLHQRTLYAVVVLVDLAVVVLELQQVMALLEVVSAAVVVAVVVTVLSEQMDQMPELVEPALVD